jgi:hypothetical protein
VRTAQDNRIARQIFELESSGVLILRRMRMVRIVMIRFLKEAI